MNYHKYEKMYADNKRYSVYISKTYILLKFNKPFHKLSGCSLLFDYASFFLCL